jgi:hypothetical protein
MRNVHQPPKPSSLVEAMRAIGYSLETSLADLIDNSITAGAKTVDILFEDSRLGEPYIAIVDDGLGMSEATLIEAMRYGSSDPRSERATHDLGRFGLGMKTASQAQCRLFTVITKRRGCAQLVGAQWDIDLIHRNNAWELQVLSDAEVRGREAQIPQEVVDRLVSLDSATAVVWRRLDRLTESLGDDGASLAHRINETRDYLGLVFHRYIDGSARRVRLQLNSQDIASHDPFLLKDAATWKVGADRIDVPLGNGRVAPIAYEAYVLPSLSRLNARQIESLTASGGLRKGQGFYIYRADRLLVWGTWFRIVKQHELSKLARIKIDVPNSLDHLWALDIRKSTAVPPEQIRAALRQAVSRVQTEATRVTTHRGHARIDKTALWRKVQVDGVTFRFEVNREHPVLDEVRAKLDESGSLLLDDLLEAMASTLPYGEIYSAMASDQRPPTNMEIPDSAVRQAQDRLRQLIATGLTQQAAFDTIMTEEPFSNYPNLPLKLGGGEEP